MAGDDSDRPGRYLLPGLDIIASAVKEPLSRVAGLRGTKRVAIACAWVAAAASLSSAAVARPPSVSFLGPTSIVRPATLRAEATAGSGRIVAVTFLLDGVPLGSDTTAPYTLDVNPGFLRPGRHRLRVAAVDSVGRRRSTGPIAVTSARFRAKAITATPGRGLDRALNALHDGDVTVRLGPGRYRLHEVELGDGARLLGVGRRTVISAPRDTSYWALLIAKGRDIEISNLTLDGGGPGPGAGIGVAVFDGSRDVRLTRLHMIHVRTHGVNVWGSHENVSVQDSRIEGDGTGQIGIYALGSDRSRDTSVIRTRIRGFRSFGVLFAQSAYGRPAAALHGLALDNVISDIRDPARDACTYAPHSAPDCGTNEGGIWTGGVEAAIIGNTIRRARWDAIETVGSSTRTTVVGNEISSTRTGIYLEHSTNDSFFSRNRIVNAGTGINVEWRHNGVGSSRNTFTFNRIVSARTDGLFVDVDDDGNQILGNTFVRGARPAIVLQGSSSNVVRGNRGCGGNGGDLVREQVGKRDGGGLAEPRQNQLVDNTVSRSCRG